MFRVISLLILLILSLPGALAKECPAILDFPLRPLASDRPESLCARYSGQVLLVVNTASRCGFTPQYEGLDALYRRYRDRGLAVLGFPSNDFAQEPGAEGEIQNFCQFRTFAPSVRPESVEGHSSVKTGFDRLTSNGFLNLKRKSCLN